MHLLTSPWPFPHRGTVAALFILAACGPQAKTTPDAGSGDPPLKDAGLTIGCPDGYALDSAVTVTFGAYLSAVGCWQATLSSTGPVLHVEGLPNFELGPLQVSIAFNAMDSDHVPCTFTNGQVIPLTSSCVTLEGSNVAQWYTFSNGGSSGGSLTINQWPSAAGQPASLTFSNDATLVQRGQASPSTVSIAGSFQTNAM